jgi:hypothetical protein
MMQAATQGGFLASIQDFLCRTSLLVITGCYMDGYDDAYRDCPYGGEGGGRRQRWKSIRAGTISLAQSFLTPPAMDMV